MLSNIKADPALAKLPVVIFITSQANSDIAQSYTLGSEPLFKKAGESSGIRRSGPIRGGVLAGLRQSAAEGETMNDSATHVLLIEDNPGDADLVRRRLVEGKTAVDVRISGHQPYSYWLQGVGEDHLIVIVAAAARGHDQAAKPVLIVVRTLDHVVEVCAV